MSTTSIQFLQGLEAYLAADDVSALEVADRLTIVKAINKCLNDWFTLAPPESRQMPFTDGLLRAPRTFPVAVTNGSSTIAFTGTPPEDSAIGCTLLVDDDAAQNSLVSLTSLALPYLGATGTHQAALYGNAIALPEGFEGLRSRPVLSLDSGTEYVLAPYEDIGHRTLGIPWLFPSATFYLMGQPTHYRVVPGRTLTGQLPLSILQVWPTPSTDARIRFDYTVQARAWSVTDFATARVLDLKDHAWNQIEALVLARLLTAGLLRDKISAQLILSEAEAARQAIRATPVAAPGTSSRVGTPQGW